MLKALVVVLLVVGLGGFAYAQAFPTPQSAEPQTAIKQAPPPATRPGDQAVDITEAELTARLTDSLVGKPIGDTPLGPATLQRITTELRNGQLKATGDAQIGSTSVPVSLTGQVRVEGARPIVAVDDVRSAGIPMPASTRASVEKSLQAQIDAEVRRLGVTVRSATIADGTLHLVGSRQ